MKNIFISLLILFFLELEPALKLCQAQSLNNGSIIKSFNHSFFGIRSALRSMPSAIKHISGSGTSLDPYLLYDAADFDSIRYLGISSAKYYKLASNIDLSTFNPWSPFGTSTTTGFRFEAHIDGDFYIIKNISLNPLLAYPSLLGCINGATVDNLIIQNVSLNHSGSTVQQYVGIVYARNYSTAGSSFRNILIDTVNITYAPSNTVSTFFFGSFGYNSSTMNTIQDSHIKNFNADFRVGTSSGNTVGGFAANGANTISRCSIVGILNTERTNANSQTGCLFFASGLTGSITDCYAIGEIKTSESYATALIYLSGFLPYRGIVTRCYTAVVVDDSLVSSYQSAFITNYSAGSGTVSNCFYDKTLFNRDGAEAGSGAVGKTTSEMKTQSTFTGWDFTNTWAIDSTKNNGYPHLLSNE